MKRWLRFLVVELFSKTLIVCLIATFVAYLLLQASPKVEAIRIPVRGDTLSTNINLNAPADTVFITRDTVDAVAVPAETVVVPVETIAAVVETVAVPVETSAMRDYADEEVDKQRISYLGWIRGVLRWEYGRTSSGQRVAEEISQKLLVTLILSFSSFLIAVPIALILGLCVRQKPVVRTRNPLLVLTALPAFFLGYLLIAFLGYHVSTVPRYILAVLTLALSSGIINDYSRVIEDVMRTESSKEYIETARAKGLRVSALPMFGTVGFHAFRNAAVTIAPRIGLIFTIVISGSMVVEQVFGLPGLSFMLLRGLAERDIGRVLIVILLGVLLVRAGSIAAMFLHVLLDPKYGERA